MPQLKVLVIFIFCFVCAGKSFLWEALTLFEIENEIEDDVEHAEAMFRAAQKKTAAHQLPVTGSSDMEDALNDMVQQYMGSMKRGGNTKASMAAGQPVRLLPTLQASKAARINRHFVEGDAWSKQDLDEHLNYMAKDDIAPHMRATEPAIDAGVSADAEREWREACLKACVQQCRTEPAKSSDQEGHFDDDMSNRRWTWVGRPVKSWGLGQVSEKPPTVTGRAPTVDEIGKLLGSLVLRAKTVVQRAATPATRHAEGALETIFIALALLADGRGEIPEQPSGMRGGFSLASDMENLDGWEKGTSDKSEKDSKEHGSVRAVLGNLLRKKMGIFQGKQKKHEGNNDMRALPA